MTKDFTCPTTAAPLPPPPYGYLPQLVTRLRAEFPQANRPWLAQRMVVETTQAGYAANRKSCYTALRRDEQLTGNTVCDDLLVPVTVMAASADEWTTQPAAKAPLPEVTITIVTDEADSSPWCVVDNAYQWRSKQGSFCRGVGEVDEMFYAYSRHGLNKSQVQMLHDFDLSLWEWNTVKSKLLLQKNSNVFSPWTVSQTAPDQLEAMMREKMSRRYDKQGPLIERAHRDAAVRQLNKLLSEQSQREAGLQRLALELSDLLPEVRYRYVARTPQALNGPEHLVCTVADPHVGADVKRLLNAPVYNQQVLYQYADQFIEKVNARGAKNVYINGLGDFIESFGGANHANSFLSLNKDLVGAGGLKAALEFFSYLVAGIYNVKEIWLVSGNHDRVSNKKDEDTRGQAAELLALLLQERYRATGISIHYRYDVLVRVVDNICYLNTHMHLGLAQGDKNLLQTVARHRAPGLYCVVLGAHLHSRITKLDTDDSRVCHSPSFFTGNGYSSDGGWSSSAGFLTVENTGWGYPRVVDEPLSAGRFAPARLAA